MGGAAASEWSGWWEGPMYVAVVAVASLLLHVLLPATKFKGYVVDEVTRKPLVYRLNGLLVMWATCVLWLLSPTWAQTALARNFWSAAVTSCVAGVLVSLHWFLRGRRKLKNNEITLRCLRAPTLDNADTFTVSQKDMEEYEQRSAGAAFYLGYEFNPRWNVLGQEVDPKMFVYMYGAVLLQLNILSVYAATPSPTNALVVYVALFTFYLNDYLFFEKVHLYTYDLFAEKLGFKLIWGCMFFYPFFYFIGMWAVTSAQEDIASWQVALSVACFFTGWSCSRGPNMQKYTCKTKPDQKKFLGFIDQKTMPGSNGRLLYSGFWGLSRHINYFGETLMGLGWALPGAFASGGTAVLPWLYIVYCVLLFKDRVVDDGVVCRRKYGDKVWDEYTKLVPYKIVPGVF